MWPSVHFLVLSAEFVGVRVPEYVILINFYQLFMGAVGLVFSPLVPLVPLAAALVFWISSFVYKYQLMYVFVSRAESGGVSITFKICRQLT